MQIKSHDKRKVVEIRTVFYLHIYYIPNTKYYMAVRNLPTVQTMQTSTTVATRFVMNQLAWTITRYAMSKY